MANKKKELKPGTLVIKNKRAAFDYEFIDTYTAGIVLTGTEIKSIQESIQSVVDASIDAQQAFGDVKQNIGETDMLVQQIRSAMEESETGSKQITDALHLMNDSSSSVRTASVEMAEGNKEILEQITNLQDATLQIKISVDKMGDGARYINDRSKALSSISGKMQESIGEIGGQIDQFTV